MDSVPNKARKLAAKTRPGWFISFLYSMEKGKINFATEAFLYSQLEVDEKRIG